MRADDPDEDEVAMLRHLETVYEDRRGFFPRFIGREGGEIAHPQESLGGVAHPGEVERFPDPPHERLEERRPAPGDLIQVRPCLGVVPRMTAVRHLLDRADADVGRKRVVQPREQRGRRQIGIQIEMRDLADRMDARVRAARAVQLEFLPPRHLANRAVDLARDRPRVLLNLPAAVSRSVVFDD